MTDFFKGIPADSLLRGRNPDNDFAFRHYDAGRKVVMGKTLKDHLRFAAAYWHSFAWPGGDPFGGADVRTAVVWRHDGRWPRLKADVAFEMFDLLGAPYFCFHDADVRPEGVDFAESTRNLEDDGGLSCRTSMADDRDQAAVGHGEPVLAPALHGWARPPTRTPRCLRFPRRRSRPAWMPHMRLGRRELCAVGGARGLRDAAEHRHGPRARAGGAHVADGCRLQAQDGLRGRDPDRTQAAGADESTSMTMTWRRSTAFLKEFGLEGEVQVNIEQGHAILAGHSFEHELATGARIGDFRLYRHEPERLPIWLGHRPIPQ